MNEEEVIKGCCDGDRRSQNALYKRYFPLMSSIALRYYPNQDEAMHGLNFGFLKVLQNIENYNQQFALATWIRKILVNHFIDEFRKNNKYISTIHLKESDEELIEYNAADLEMDADSLRAMLSNLPTVTGKVFNLFAIDGFKHKEISTMLKINEGTSKWHVSEARKLLKESILKEVDLEKKRPDKQTAAG